MIIGIMEIDYDSISLYYGYVIVIWPRIGIWLLAYYDPNTICLQLGRAKRPGLTTDEQQIEHRLPPVMLTSGMGFVWKYPPPKKWSAF